LLNLCLVVSRPISTFWWPNTYTSCRRPIHPLILHSPTTTNIPGTFNITCQNMPSSPRTDSPVISTFPRRLSAATPALARITEQPRQQKPVLKCLTAIASKMSSLNPNYTFFDSASDTSSSLVSSKAFPPLAQVPSYLSVHDLGYENVSDNDWSVDWDVYHSTDKKGHKARLPDLPVIRDRDFAYHPKIESRWIEHGSGGSLKLARKRMERRRSEIESTKGFKGFLAALLRKMGLGGRR
jgi:hypothetical protein